RACARCCSAAASAPISSSRPPRSTSSISRSARQSSLSPSATPATAVLSYRWASSRRLLPHQVAARRAARDALACAAAKEPVREEGEDGFEDHTAEFAQRRGRSGVGDEPADAGDRPKQTGE